MTELEQLTAERDAVALVAASWTAATIALLNVGAPGLAKVAAAGMRIDAEGNPEAEKTAAALGRILIESYNKPSS